MKNPNGPSREEKEEMMDALYDRETERSSGPHGSAFDKWWIGVGQYYDPDTADVPWEDKRRFLAELAFDAATEMAKSNE